MAWTYGWRVCRFEFPENNQPVIDELGKIAEKLFEFEHFFLKEYKKNKI